MYAAGVILPMVLFSTILLGLVYGYRVDPEAANKDIDIWENSSHRLHNGYIYVHYSSAQLLFITSWSSSMAPVLLCFLMKLWQIEASRDIIEASKGSNHERLITPYQLSLIINMSTGTLSELITYIKYLLWKKKAKQPPVLTKSASILIFGGLIYVAIVAVDTTLHYTTPTALHRKYSRSSLPSSSFGRQLQQECVNFNRIGNDGLPCSYIIDNGTGNLAHFRDRGEVYRLLNSQSSKQEIRKFHFPELYNGDLQALFPRAQDIPSGINFYATTLGVSTQCTPMTRQRGFTYLPAPILPTGENILKDPRTVGSLFSYMYYCSRDLHGGGTTLRGLLLDAYTLEMSTTGFIGDAGNASSGYFQYYTDASMTRKWHSNLTQEQDDAILSSSYYSSSEDVNPTFLGILGSVTVQNNSAGNSLMNDWNISSESHNLLSGMMALNCTFSAHDVNFHWSNGSISNVTYSLAADGTTLGLFISLAEEFMLQIGSSWRLASLQSSAQDFATDYAISHSSIALSAIGSVLVPKRNLEEVT